MAKKIIWSKSAAEDFNRLVNYLQEDWGDTVTTRFTTKFFSLLNMLSQWPAVGRIQVKKEKIRGLMVSRYNKLFYRIEKDKIILLKIFDMRRNPNKLKFK